MHQTSYIVLLAKTLGFRVRILEYHACAVGWNVYCTAATVERPKQLHVDSCLLLPQQAGCTCCTMNATSLAYNSMSMRAHASLPVYDQSLQA